jgi:hypothetical protein
VPFWLSERLAKRLGVAEKRVDRDGVAAAHPVKDGAVDRRDGTNDKLLPALPQDVSRLDGAALPFVVRIGVIPEVVLVVEVVDCDEKSPAGTPVIAAGANRQVLEIQVCQSPIEL